MLCFFSFLIPAFQVLLKVPETAEPLEQLGVPDRHSSPALFQPEVDGNGSGLQREKIRCLRLERMCSLAVSGCACERPYRIRALRHFVEGNRQETGNSCRSITEEGARRMRLMMKAWNLPPFLPAVKKMDQPC